jgi:hypothetical protein
MSMEMSDTAMYSISAEERAIKVCFVDLHMMGALLSRVTCPEIDFRVSTSVPQSASA